MQRKQTENSEDLVVARVFLFRHEAEFARGMLESEGIEAMIEADDCGGQRPLMGAVTGVKLLVRRSDVQKAKGLLR
jgi:hypothetical protein